MFGINKNNPFRKQIDDFIEESYNIQIAKGLHAMPKGFREAWKQKKRELHLKKTKNGRK